eukprot:9477756-Pyramimonas_sp.AAC.1
MRSRSRLGPVARSTAQVLGAADESIVRAVEPQVPGQVVVRGMPEVLVKASKVRSNLQRQNASLLPERDRSGAHGLLLGCLVVLVVDVRRHGL